ncbi:MAG: 4-(cytidine 5'-diphospho)-2-C-methyl-D-erythritol kinase [Bdellovibrio bacteriovorus]
MTAGPASDGSAWPAPAKLNLMLRILGRRPDGYHRLQTIFQFIDRQDRLWFEVRRDGLIRRCSPVAGVPERLDLTLRAAHALQELTGCRLGADIRIDKVLPLGGGLGGGSSDAATTLVALNHLWGLHLSQDALASLGLGLGADVPVFVRGLAAWGEGVGEDLSPVVLPEPWYLVVVPPCQVPTGAVFGHPKLTRDSLPVTLADFLLGARGNDCLPVVSSGYPQVAAALEWLNAQGQGRLTGTGACCFAEFADQGSARAALGRLPPQFDGFVARGLNRSPLLDRLVDGESTLPR